MPTDPAIDLPRNASIGRRLASLCYEGLLLLGVLMVAYLLPQVLLGMASGFLLPGYVSILYLLLVPAVYFLAYWRHGGQTLAMQTWGLRLTDTQGNPPELPRLLLRYILCWPSIGGFGVGLLWAWIDRDRQFLHDRIAGTRIIFVPPTKASSRQPAGK